MRGAILHRAAPPIAPDAVPRLLAGLGRDVGRIGLAEHIAQWGSLDVARAGHHAIEELDASGLLGHGGAWFPVAAKWRSIRGGRSRRPVVVANGAEGEPASAKDALLLTSAPHLVLDGAAVAAAALGARRVVVYVPGARLRAVSRAVDERRRSHVDPVDFEVILAPEAYLSGQESAVVNTLDGRGAGMPSFVGVQPVRERGVGGRPTLVQNVETLAHVALVSRFGSQWFRGVGAAHAPGTKLVTVSGRFASPRVVEVPLGTPLREVVGLTPGTASEYVGALLGGYGGTWISMDTLLGLELTEEAARRSGATLGPGIVALLPRSVCPLVEVARVVRYMERQSAGQCGPCVHGLAALDEVLHALAFQPRTLKKRIDPVLQLCSLVEGRGACRHPDGVARFVRSACSVFSAEVVRHLGQGPCRLIGAPSVLPFRGPRPGKVRAREWIAQ